MEYIFHRLFLAHNTGMHPERGERLHAFRYLPDSLIEDGESSLSLVHTPEYIDRVKRLFKNNIKEYADTIISPHSFEAACLAAGAAIQAAQTGNFALVRPPGHHAYADHGSGFCLFNNIAIACAHLRSQGKRVVILDFDGHYGDGTSSIFYKDDQVLYWSFHQYPAFPGIGMVHESGHTKGRGHTVNIPLPPGSGDDIFWDAFHQTVPIIEQFAPDVLAISAGFDSHYFDPLLQLHLSRDCYYLLGKEIALRFPNHFAVLEGGYNYEELPKCIANFVAGIHSNDIPHPEGETSSSLRSWESYEIYIHALIAEMKPYWKI